MPRALCIFRLLTEPAPHAARLLRLYYYEGVGSLPGESTTEGKRAQGPTNVISLRGHQDAEQALDDLFGAPFGRGHYSAALTRALNVGAPVVAAAVRRLSSNEPDNLLKLGDLLTR